MANNHVEYNTDLLYEVDDKGERILVRSIESSQRAYLRFSNKTSRPVDVWWRDFRGSKRLYVRLAARASYDVNSYITHPWEFTDAVTKERYVIDNKPVFRPPSSIGGMLHRTNWNITIRIRTLRATALLVAALRLSNPGDIDALELPREIANDLQRLVVVLHRPAAPAPTSRD